MMDSNSVWYLRLGIWVVLVAANLWLLFGIKHAKIKKTLLPVLAVLAGGAMVLLALRADYPRDSLYLEVPLLILITVGNLWQFRVCGSCARLVRGEFFGRPQVCDKCGAKLGAKQL
jgi:hypothetical protein